MALPLFRETLLASAWLPSRFRHQWVFKVPTDLGKAAVANVWTCCFQSGQQVIEHLESSSYVRLSFRKYLKLPSGTCEQRQF